MKYVAFLRGINVGGKNKVPMSDLKAAFENYGLTQVRTYINSGNVLFESDKTDSDELASVCGQLIEKQFGFPVVCAVLSELEYKQSLDSAPKFWGTGEADKRSDALFMISPKSAKDVVDAVGPINNEIEWIEAWGPVVFWTVDMKYYGRSRLPKIIGSEVYRYFTMRSSTTARKIYEFLTD